MLTVCRDEVFDAKDIERAIYSSGSNTFGVYVGFQEINGIVGLTKVGRTINVRALQRGRSQGGANWWFYAWWPLESREQTYAIEKQIKTALLEHTIKGVQGQKELYALSADKITDIICKHIGTPILRSLAKW